MKLNTKFSLALIALVGIGVFALPSTVALFSGQHSFYNIDATGNQIPCVKCHGDVKAELSASGYSNTTGTPGPHANFKCEYCHRAEAGQASGDDAYASLSYGNITLVTTVWNFENGNFPRQIVYQTGMNTSNWNGNIWMNQTLNQPFTNQLGANNAYVGSLSSGSTSKPAVAGTIYTYSRASEVATEVNGTPIDTNPNTSTTAFNANAVTWYANNGSANLYGAGSKVVTPGSQYHAASLVSCLECHGGDQNKGIAGYQVTSPEPYNHAGWLIDPTDPNSQCSNCHYGNTAHTGSFNGILQAGGFGLTDYTNDTGALEAHNSWVKANDSISRYGYGASNDACVACHTHVAVEINFTKGYLLQFSASEYANGTYVTSGANVQGTVNITTYGNSSGNAFAVSNSTYEWTPANGTLYINGSNVTVTGLHNATTSDNSTALITS